jgi:hypothetical protein
MKCPKDGEDAAILATEWSGAEPVDQFTDEDNNPHIHDPKTFRRTYRCPNGHEFTRKGQVPCPSCSWPKVKEKKK